MKPWYTRPVFFVSDADASIGFYVDALGCNVDWNHSDADRTLVSQVSRPGFELILARDTEKAGRGRVFVSLDAEQARALRGRIDEQQIPARDSWWGMPVIQIVDLDGNELLFSPPAATE